MEPQGPLPPFPTRISLIRQMTALKEQKRALVAFVYFFVFFDFDFYLPIGWTQTGQG